MTVYSPGSTVYVSDTGVASVTPSSEKFSGRLEPGSSGCGDVAVKSKSPEFARSSVSTALVMVISAGRLLATSQVTMSAWSIGNGCPRLRSRTGLCRPVWGSGGFELDEINGERLHVSGLQVRWHGDGQ